MAQRIQVSWVTGSVNWLRRNIRLVNIIGGSMLILVGLLMVTGWWDHVVQWAQLRTVEFGETAL